MKISRLDQIRFDSNSVVTLGSFDGIHLGHQSVISKLVEEAKNIKGRSVLLTFEPHPLMTLNPEKGKELRFITPFDEKIERLEPCGLDELCVISFDREFADMTGHDFVSTILLKKIGLKKFLLGFDQAFGKNRTANNESLLEMSRTMHFELQNTEAILSQGVKLSSGLIRKLISDGDLILANRYLTYSYRVTGNVIKGDGRGRRIGFPTANVKPNHPQKLIPGKGVYACYAIIDGNRMKAVTNIGTRPTFSDQTESVIEAHLLNFEGDLYDRQLALEFLFKIRDEKRFSGSSELKNQVASDIEVFRKQSLKSL